jgi:hypothetical protein
VSGVQIVYSDEMQRRTLLEGVIDHSAAFPESCIVCLACLPRRRNSLSFVATASTWSRHGRSGSRLNGLLIPLTSSPPSGRLIAASASVTWFRGGWTRTRWRALVFESFFEFSKNHIIRRHQLPRPMVGHLVV